MSSLVCRFLKLGALALVCVHDDGFVIALDVGRHETPLPSSPTPFHSLGLAKGLGSDVSSPVHSSALVAVW